MYIRTKKINTTECVYFFCGDLKDPKCVYIGAAMDTSREGMYRPYFSIDERLFYGNRSESMSLEAMALMFQKGAMNLVEDADTFDDVVEIFQAIVTKRQYARIHTRKPRSQ